MNNYLYHYGVKGMKWGVRKEYKPIGRRRSKQKVENEENSKKGLTDKQKRAIKIGVAAAATTLAVYGGYKLYKSGKLDKYIEAGKHHLEKTGNDKLQFTDKAKKLSTEAGLKLKTKASSLQDDVKLSNPDYDGSSASWANNCSHATIAHVLRRMGLDVKAKPMSFDEEGGISYAELGRYFGGIKKDMAVLPSASTAEGYKTALERQILSTQGKEHGSVGIMRMAYTSGGGHFMCWENVKGHIVFTNPQNDVDVDKWFGGMARSVVSDRVVFSRMDNLELKARAIKNVVENI